MTIDEEAAAERAERERMRARLGYWPGDEGDEVIAGPPTRRIPLNGLRRELCEKWRGLPVSLARQYRKRIRAALGITIDRDDLESAAILGLVIAASKFEPERGLSLSTYAWKWIFQQMQRHVLYQHHTVRIPPDVLKDIRRIENGLEPVGSTAAARAAAQKILRSERRLPEWPYEPAARAMRADFELADRLRDALRWIDPRSREVIELRFGLTGGRALTLEEVAAVIGRTRERVRQLEAKALARIERRLRPLRRELTA